jgi:serine/threonine protein phosphatase 1
VIDYGPDTRGVIQLLIDLSRRCQLIILEGNHEEMLFRARESSQELNSWLYSGGEDTLKCYPGLSDRELIDSEHFDFLKGNCRVFHETEQFIFVHANYFPNVPMSQQSGQTLRWEFVEPSQMAPHYSRKIVIAGHTPQTNGELLDLGFLKVIDTDCSRGGWLTALEDRNGTLIQANQSGEVRSGKRIIGANSSN